MTLPASGPFNFGQITGELGLGTSAPFNMDRLDARALAQVSLTPGTPYSMSSFYNRTCLSFTVTVGTDGGSGYGFNNLGSSWGSIAPSNLRDVIIRSISLASGFFSIAATPTPTFGRNTFWGVILRAGTSFTDTPVIALRSADATYGVDGFGAFRWSWPGVGLNWAPFLGQNVLVQLTF